MTSSVVATNQLLATDDNMPYTLMALEAADEIGIDTETTGLNVRNGVDYLMGVCFSVEGLSGYIPFRHKTDNVSQKWITSLFDVLVSKPLIWHNRKFDWHSIRTLGVDPTTLQGPQYDTLIIAHLVDEELYSKELNFLAKKFLNSEKEDSDEIHKLGEIYGWRSIPPDVIAPYGATDADLTRRLKHVLWPKLVNQGLESVYWDTESPLTTALYRMEQRGVGVNSDLANQLAQRGRSRMATIQREFRFNPASTVDLGNYLLDELGLPVLGRTPKGKPSFAKVYMEQYDEILQASNNPAARLIAEYRGWQKATTSLYEPLLEKVGPDGRVRTQFKQHGTVTGRLSASDPNLQQVPRGSNKQWNGHAKACFTSGREGYKLYGWDYSQIELRLAAAYGQEQVLLTEFEREESDPFRVYCEILFGEFTPEGRQDTKTFFYANLYGAGLERIDATLGWNNLAKTEPIFRKFRSSIPGITEIAHRINNLMAQQGYVSYWDGRRRHIKNKREAHKAWNSVIQGGAAQLVKQAILRCEEFADDDCYPVLTVHDEITFVVRNEAIPDYEPKITKAMCDFPRFPVRFAIEGKAWGGD
jgi:DNA polymerase-1